MRVMTGQMTKRARVTGRTLGWKQSRIEYLRNQALASAKLTVIII